MHPSRAVAWALFVGGVVLVTLLHLFHNGTNIDHREFWHDESSHFMVSCYPLGRVVWLAITDQFQPPLHYLIVHFVGQISSSEVALRGLSWLFCLLLLYFVLLAMDELSLAARFAFAVGMTTSGYMHYLAQEMRPYALAALTTLVSSVLFVRLLAEPRSRRRFALYLGSALLMLASLAFDVWVLVAHGLYAAALILARGRGRLREALREHRTVIVALAVAGAAYIPYLVVATMATRGWLRATHPLTDRLYEMVRFDGYREVLLAYAGDAGMATALLLGLALSAILSGARRRNPLTLLLLLLFLGQIAFVRVFLFDSYGASLRYFTPAFPVFFWCVALGVDRLLGARRRFFVAPGILALSLLTWAEAPAFAQYLRTAPPRPNWRRLYDETRAIPGKKAFFADRGAYAQMLEYLARDDPDYLFFTNGFEKVPRRNISLMGKPMTKPYIEDSVREAAPEVRCFFYMNNKRQQDTNLFVPVFVAAMTKIGFRQVFHSTSTATLWDPYHDWFDVVGYCRPA